MPPVRWRRSLHATSVVGWLCLASAAAWAQPNAAPSNDALAAARALFGEALRAEEAGDFAEALEKFQQVRAVRDTASIEYRIGTCYEGLGDLVLAFRAYSAAGALGTSDPQTEGVSRAASERRAALAKRVGQLTLTMPSPARSDVEVKVDGVSVTPAGPIALTAGHHVVLATAPGAIPYRSEIALAEGAEVALSVILDPQPPPPPTPPLTAPPATPIAPPPTETHALSPAPWFMIGGGGALIVGASLLLVVRQNDITRLDAACPGGTCPPGSNEGDLKSTQNRALVEGPAALACGLAGIALAAGGIYWVVGQHQTTEARAALLVSPRIGRGAMGVLLSAAWP